MQPRHYLTLAIAVALIAILYYGANTIPPLKKPEARMQRPNSGGAVAMGGMPVRASFDSILLISRAKLKPAVKDSVAAVEKELTGIRDSSKMTGIFSRLSGLWERGGQLPVAAYYQSVTAKLENSEKKLTFAGQFFLQLMENENSSSIQAWEAGEAVRCLEQSLKLNPDNEETKLALATGYIEGTGEPMRGVQILLAITREKPDDIPENMLLGRMSNQSGQFDKAIGRFESILKLEPENKEALYFLAQAYEGKGDKNKAIELLQQCKKVVNDPAFSRDIDQKINSLK